MVIKSEVCSPWATEGDLCSPCDDYTLDSAEMTNALLIASDILFNFTRRRWPGLCEEVVRPCVPTSSDCTYSGSSCSCGLLSEIHLPGTPVVSITEVKVDGVVVPASEYEILDASRLAGRRKADGTRRSWPSCQDLTYDDTHADTWSVRYMYGAEPPIGGIRAAASLACQLLMACQPEAVRDGRCRLPKRITSITRQGVTLAILDPLTLFQEGLTGLPEVDLWVSSVNRGDGSRRAMLVDPLRARSVRREG